MPTPNLDRMAHEGIRFTQFYVASPICSPSRTGCTTGMFPARWRITSYLQTRQGNANCGQADFLDPKAPSLSRLLKAGGYATAHIGKWHMGGGRDVTNALPMPTQLSQESVINVIQASATIKSRIYGDPAVAGGRWLENLIKNGIDALRDGKGTIHIVGKGAAPAGALPPPEDRMAGKAGLPPVSGVLDPTLPPTLTWAEPTVALRRDGQGRLVIRNAPRGEPPKGDKEEMHRRLSPVMVEAAYLYGLPVSLIEAVIKVESNFQPAAVSPKGAMGLMQLMPGTAKFLGVEDAFSPRENVLGGTRYLRLLLDFFGQSLPLTLAAYNAGFQRVIDAGCQVPNIKETQDSVARVMGHYYLREKQRLAQRLML